MSDVITSEGVPADEAKQAEVVEATKDLPAAELPAPDDKAAESTATAVLLLPEGTEIDAALEKEIARLGVGAVVIPGSSGQSRLHDAAAAAGLDTSRPLVWIEQLLVDVEERAVAEVDLGVAATVIPDPKVWTDVGRPKILTPVLTSPEPRLRVTLYLKGSVEVQLLEDDVPLALEPGALSGDLTLATASSASSAPPGSHVYRVQARGDGAIEAASLSVVMTAAVRRA